MKTTDYIIQAEDFLKSTNTTFKAKFYKYDKYFADDKEARNIYKITLKRKRKSVRSYTFTFGTSINDTMNNIEPCPYDVLACIEKYGYDSFEDFCNELGYDPDSRKAEKIYKAVINQYINVNRLFSDVIEDLRNIQ